VLRSALASRGAVSSAIRGRGGLHPEERLALRKPLDLIPVNEATFFSSIETGLRVEGAARLDPH
jgi:hypothetical protein